MQLTKNFSLAELTVTGKPFDNTPNAKQIESLRALAENILQPLRDEIGRPIRVTSGFRSEKVNAAVKGSKTSQHKRGEAADIKVAGMTARQVALTIVAMGLPFDQVINEYDSWVHVSYGPRHRRDRRKAVKQGPKGAERTVYLPNTL
jgi:zinc D-Ala-D-Ala carboxypeptidase